MTHPPQVVISLAACDNIEKFMKAAILHFLSPEVFNSPILYSVFSYEIQHTFITVLILIVFSLIILQEPITHIFVKEDRNDDQKFEAKYFWQTVLVIPILSVPFLWLMYKYGIFTFYPGHGEVLLMIIQLFAMLILHDTYFYWCHRLLHTNKLWRIHSIHHKAVEPTLVSSHVFHFIETFINYTFTGWFILLAGILFGGVYYLPIMLFVIFTISWNIYGHGRKDLFPKKIREGFPGKYIIWSHYHHLHHQKGRGNFGFLLVFWDSIMGTRIRE